MPDKLDITISHDFSEIERLISEIKVIGSAVAEHYAANAPELAAGAIGYLRARAGSLHPHTQTFLEQINLILNRDNNSSVGIDR